MKLKDKVAIVTGAGSGIGRGIALRFAKEGADVVVADINVNRANNVANEIRGLNRKAIVTKVDVANSKEVNQMVKSALDEFGKIDILVSNAGGSAREKATLFYESTEEVWDLVIGKNLKGVFNCARAVLPHMIQKRSGKILSTASVAGVNATGSPVKGAVEYAAVKAGIIGFTRALAKEVGKFGITVNCYSPGPIETEEVAKAFPEIFEGLRKRNYMGRLGTPEDVANVAAFLASSEADWITGQNYIVCGGESLGW